MNIHKHMEAIFLAALTVVGGSSFALDAMSDATARASAAAPVMRDVAVQGSAAAVACAPVAPRHAA